MSFVERRGERSTPMQDEKSIDELLSDGFAAFQSGNYERAYDILSTEIEGYTGRDHRDRGYKNPDCLANIVAREENYEKLPEHLNELVYGEGKMYDIEDVRSRIAEIAEKFTE